MYNHKSFLAIIPARSGSKGLLDKNIREINHKPLMAYTIEACVRAKVFDEIVVSTDSLQYAEIARAYGASVPFIRPKQLATDSATTCDVILHVLKELEALGRLYDYFMLLQPTSPLRKEEDMMQSISILFKNDANAVVSLCATEHSSSLIVPLNRNGRLDYVFDDRKQTRRQSTKPEFRINGAIYLCSTQYFLNYKSFYGEKSYPYIMSKLSSIDIDDSDQLKLVEALMLIKA